MRIGSNLPHGDAFFAPLSLLEKEEFLHDKFLGYFDAVASHGSIRRAAAHLSVSSSSLNRKIISVEERLGVRLFERHADGVKLTSAGTVILEHCRNTIFDFQRVLTVVDDIRNLRTGNIRIATLDSLAISILPGALAEFSRSYPEMSFTVRTAQPFGICREVADGEADVGISFSNEPAPGVRILTEKSTPIGAIMRPDHPLAERDGLDLDDLSPFQLIRSDDRLEQHSLWKAASEQMAVKVPTQVHTNSLPLAKSLIRKTHGIGIYTKLGFLQEIEAGELHYIGIRTAHLRDLKIGILISSKAGLSPASHLLCRQLSKSLKGLRLDS